MDSGPQKGFLTLSEIVILSVVWGAASNLCQNVMKQGIGSVFRRYGLATYTVDLLVACTLLAVTFAMVLLFTNVNIGRRGVFELVENSGLPMSIPSASPEGALDYKLVD